MVHKRSTTATVVTATIGGDSLLERLPENLLNEIFVKFEQETLSTLCSLACVSRTLQSSVNNVLSSFSSVDLSAFSLDSRTFDGIRSKLGNLQKVTLDCLRLSDSSIRNFLLLDVEELILLKCSSLSYKLLSSIGKTCPNLRVFTLEFSGFIDKSSVFDLNLKGSLENCRYLESLKIKIRGGEINDYGFMLLGIYHLLPETLKILKLQPASSLDTLVFFRTVPIPTTFTQTLTHISLVLDIITDTLIHTITHSLPLLTDLDLKDQPSSDTSDDLSDLGIQALIHCKHLTTLSLIRIRHHNSNSFKRTTDMGFFLLSEGCKQLESVRLSGFSKVSDAGFTSILNSCSNLKKFEIQNASLLTDLSFQDLNKVTRSLEEVKLVSCNSITSEGVHELTSCNQIKILDLFGCKSVADSCLGNVSKLRFLTYLNLSGADVTDSGMVSLGKSYAPITFLSLRGCKRVTDKGISHLLLNEGEIGKNLSCLDLGHMPGITDSGVGIIVDVCIGLVELCIRNCFHVTDVSMKVLGLKGGIRRVDAYNCSGLTVGCFEVLKKPFFRGLHWIGIGRTRVMCVVDGGFDEIYRERPWLTICGDGCEVGCHDGWQFHNFQR